MQICMQSIKEHNLKANHNLQFSTVIFLYLYAIYQRTQSESKSQLPDHYPPKPFFCMQSIKEHNLKANHNPQSGATNGTNLYAIYQRTQSESKSQLIIN